MDIIEIEDSDRPLIYRRATLIQESGATVTAEMEDDFHHFRVTMTHSDGRVTAVRGESLRFPWSSCGAEAAGKIGELTGSRLDSLRAQLTTQQRYGHCTHLFDLAELAVSLALSPSARRSYQSAVALVPQRGPISAELRRNGRDLFQWEIDGGVVSGAEPVSGVKLNDLGDLAREQKDADMREALLYQQRAIHVSAGRIFDWEVAGTAADMQLPPTCHTFQPGTAGRAARMPGSTRDFAQAAESMLGGKELD